MHTQHTYILINQLLIMLIKNLNFLNFIFRWPILLRWTCEDTGRDNKTPNTQTSFLIISLIHTYIHTYIHTLINQVDLRSCGGHTRGENIRPRHTCRRNEVFQLLILIRFPLFSLLPAATYIHTYIHLHIHTVVAPLAMRRGLSMQRLLKTRPSQAIRASGWPTTPF